MLHELELLADVHSLVGTLPSWILVVLASGAAWRLTRGGTGSAVSELSEANRVLERRLQETRDHMGAEIRDLRVENAELKGRTDVTVAIAPLIEWSINHERRAQERHELTLETSSRNTDRIAKILELVAHRLGPEPNGKGDDQ